MDPYPVSQPQTPWTKFTQREEAKHGPEDDRRLCDLTQSTAQVIEKFLAADRNTIHMDDQVPRRRQVLRDFLNEVVPDTATAVRPYSEDVERHSNDTTIALVDDRQNHIGCGKIILKPCNECRIFSKSVRIPELCLRLQRKASQPSILVSTLTHSLAEKIGQG
jgi:hypothetical protein